MPLSFAGPPAPTLGGAWTAWQLDPLLVVVVLGAVTAYLLGLLAVRRRGRSWPVGRSVAFLALGVGGLAVAGLGWPAVYAPALFSVYALQVVALLMVVPMLLGLGRPVELALTALPDKGAAGLRRVLDSRPARLITVPVVSPFLLAVVPFVLFFTRWYPDTLQHPALHAASNLLLLAIGLAVLVPLWEAGTIGARIPYALALLFAFIELLADAVPGIVVRLNTHVIAAAQLTRPWGAPLLHDQQLGGDLLWCIGEAIDVPFLALLAVQWYRSDARHAQQVDQALDAAMAAAPDSGGGAQAGAELSQPWWEQDASVFGDRAGQFRRRSTG